MTAHLLQRARARLTRFGRALADYQGRMFLTLFYFLLLAPIGLFLRITSRSKPAATESHWLPYPPSSGTLEEARRQSG